MPCLERQIATIILSICLRGVSGASPADPASVAIPRFQPSPSWIDSIRGKTTEERSQSVDGSDFELNVKVILHAVPLIFD